MRSDEFLESITKHVLFYLLQAFNTLTNFLETTYTHTQRCVKGVYYEYKDTKYYFYPDSEIPYIGKEQLEHPAGIPLPTWIYTKDTQTFTQTSMVFGKSVEEHRFPWIDIDLKKEEQEISLLEYIPSVRWIGSAAEPPPLALLIRAWSLDQGLYLPLDGMAVTILHREGVSYTIPISEGYPEGSIHGTAAAAEDAEEAQEETEEDAEETAEASEVEL